jgi:uncharacterized membrane protein YphA (DoxX/SURF4 family)
MNTPNDGRNFRVEEDALGNVEVPIDHSSGAQTERSHRNFPTGVARYRLVPVIMLSARTLEVVAGLGLALGAYPRRAAVALLACLIPTTLLAHAFWQVAGAATFTVQLLNFLKNTAMAGGLLFLGATQSPTNTASASFAVKCSSTREKREGPSQIRACVLISGMHRRWKGRRS